MGRSSFVKGKHARRQELKGKVGLKEDYLVGLFFFFFFKTYLFIHERQR